MKCVLVVFAALVTIPLLGCGGPTDEVEADAETGSTVTQSSCDLRQCSSYEGTCILLGGKALCCNGDYESTCTCSASGMWVCD